MKTTLYVCYVLLLNSICGCVCKFGSFFFPFAVKSNITVHQNGELQISTLAVGSSENGDVESDAPPAEDQLVSEITEAVSKKDEVKKGKGEKSKLFDKLFKKKADRVADGDKVAEKEKQTSSEDQVDVGQPTTDPQQVSDLFHFSVNMSGNTFYFFDVRKIHAWTETKKYFLLLL